MADRWWTEPLPEGDQGDSGPGDEPPAGDQDDSPHSPEAESEPDG